jgi:hypothetical protein
MSIIRGLPRWTGERTLSVRGQLETLTWRQYRRRCGEIRRIWIKVVEETPSGEVIDFGAGELSLEEERGIVGKDTAGALMDALRGYQGEG